VIKRPRLLFLSQTLPYPPDGGVKIRTFHVLRQLAGTFDVTALCFYRWKEGAHEPNVAETVRALAQFGRVEAFPIPQEHSRARWIWDHARSLVSRRTYTVYTYQTVAFRRRLQELLATEAFDLVHADSLDLSAYFTMVLNLPLVCVHHDIQSVLLRRRGEHETTSLRRAYALHQASLMEREERRWADAVTLNVTVSSVDRETLEGLAPRARVTVVPNGVDTSYFEPAGTSSRQAGLIFVGGSSWFPNADAIAWFCEAILPRIREVGIDARVMWVGRASSAEQRRYTEKFGIRVTGYVEDVRPYIRDAACYVVPIRVGGGTRIKILDAWAMGKAIVSTSIGCEGLEAVHGRNILVHDEPEEFARAVASVLRDTGLRAGLEREGRATAETRYSWDVIGRDMNATYLRLVTERNERMQVTAPPR
jgi:polysaccharide biosynthesis protein PslH